VVFEIDDGGGIVFIVRIGRRDSTTQTAAVLEGHSQGDRAVNHCHLAASSSPL
jgi:hypothetical protein